MILQIAHDIVEDIIVQGDKMRDTLQQLQDAVYLTKVYVFFSLTFKDIKLVFDLPCNNHVTV